MSGAIRFLLIRTARHRTMAQLRRVAEPRYAIAAGLGLAYLASLMARPPRAELAAAPVAEIALVGGSIGLAIWTAWMWTFGRGSRLVALAPAEVTFLLAGPVGTTRLLAYKLARGQLAIIANALLWAIFFGWSGGGLDGWRAFPAAWLLLSTLQLHHLGATLARAQPAEASGARRWTVELVAGAVSAAVVVLAAAEMWPFVRAGLSAGIDHFLPALGAALEQPVLRIVLAPFEAALAPLVAPSLAAWAAAIPAAVAILAAHALWLFAVRARFRKVATETRQRGDGRSRRQVWSPTLTRLHPEGRAALALTWKNVAAVARQRRAAVLFAGAVAVALAAVLAGRTVAPLVPQAVVAVAGVWAAAFTLLGPQWVRNDLRTDLRHLDSLRSWPLSGAAIVAAEVLASTLVLTAAQLALISVGAAAAAGSGTAETGPWLGTAIVGVLAGLPVVNWLHLLVHNGLAVLYPGWVPLGPEPRTGIEGLGQQAIVLIAGLGGVILLLLPAILVAAFAVGAAMWLGTGDDEARTAGLIIGMPVALGTSLLAVRWLGERMELIEPGDIDGGAQARG